MMEYGESTEKFMDIYSQEQQISWKVLLKIISKGLCMGGCKQRRVPKVREFELTKLKSAIKKLFTNVTYVEGIVKDAETTSNGQFANISRFKQLESISLSD